MVRIKQRYLLLNILYPSTKPATKATAPNGLSFQTPTPDYVDAGRLVVHLRSQISLLFGDYGVGVSLGSLKVVYFSAATSTAILRVPRNHHRLIWAALSYITELPAPRRGGTGDPCVIRVVRVSGTIRKAEEELLRRARRDVVRAKLAQESMTASSIVKSVTQTSVKPVDERDPDVSMQSIEDLSEDEDLEYG